MNTTAAKTTHRALPWLAWGAQVDAQIAAGVAREQAARLAQGAVVNGTPTYSESNGDRYTVGYGGERNYPAKSAAAPARDYTPSDAQIQFLNNLLAERLHGFTVTEVANAKADWRKIRPMLDALKAKPKRPYVAPVVEAAPEAPKARLDFSAIPDSNYALGTDEEGDPIKFYRVSSSKSGFKNVQVRASDDLFDLSPKAGIAVLHKIVAFGISESQMLFANRLERCYTCGKSLTDQASRDAGQGPTCRNK